MTTGSTDGSRLGKIAAYIEILAKDPRSTVFVPLAETYRQAGLLDDALQVATRGVNSLSTFSPGYTVLGRIQAQRGDLEAAARAFEKALLIDAENLTAVKGLAKVRVRQGNREEALKLAQRALRLSPDDAAVSQLLEALQGSLPAGSACQDQSRTSPPPAGGSKASGGPISTATIAEIYIRQGFLNRAVKVYRDLLKVDPHNEEIRGKLVALKQRIEAGDAPSMAPESPGETAPPAFTAPSEPPVAEPDLPPVSDLEVNSSARQMEELERWLESIRRRRSHVQ